jgi:GNAT superfamily N-acetyltransferase
VPDLRPSPTRAIAKTLNRAKTRGLTEVLSLAGGRVKEWFSSSDDLVMFVRDAIAEAPDRDDLTFTRAVPSDGARYAIDIGTDSATTFATRLSDDTHCFLVSDGETLLHASWVTTGGAWTRELRAYLVPPGDDAYIYESFTRSDARGRGVYPFALANILEWGATTGIGRLWVAVEEHNPPSLRAVGKAGFQEAFRLPFSRSLGRLRIGAPTGPQAGAARAFLSRKPPKPDM